MIVRVIAIDPLDPQGDVLIYQVPENSKAYALLIRLLSEAEVEHATLMRQKKANVQIEIVEADRPD